MKIGEIARAAGVSTSRIRFYEREGIIPNGERRANGYRDYPADLVGLLMFIEQAQSLGFTLREIAQIGAQPGGHIISCDDAMTALAAKNESISALIAEAEDRKRRIELLMADLAASKAGRPPILPAPST
ncbi:MerR family transcriptional regulator [uncultured Paracoccus sp.]|uniref:MerR family transcriptional regulator n=1 Tax=uncultured Paracoccus sp. TaxID=189685 RepID=UPI0026025DE7|nr:MerR family transcriptional regulator [uncultured Paracoccus sp.]